MKLYKVIQTKYTTDYYQGIYIKLFKDYFLMISNFQII